MIPLLLGLLLASSIHADTVLPGFEENLDGPIESSELYQHMKRESVFADTEVEGVLRKKFHRLSEQIVIPGTASSAPLPEIAKVVGPSGITNSFRIGDTVFLRWMGAPGPHEGDRYSIYSPAVILQNLENPTEFSVVVRNPENEKNEKYRRAGYFYESAGVLRITRISQGLVEAVIENLSGVISIGDHIMPVLPKKTVPKPIVGEIQLSAAIVSGSPADRLSTTPRSFIYINRGSRDGIREGRVFQSVETAKVEGTTQGPEMLAGEAIVVQVSDSFSVAMITKQFEVIRIGSLLKSKQTNEDTPSLEPFHNFNPNKMNASTLPGETVEEVPTMGELKATEDKSLPDPALPKLPVKPSLSELDAIEQANKFNALTPKERERLGSLSRQEKIDEDVEEEESSTNSPLDSSVGGKKPEPKKGKKKAKQSRDEEELNQLMMQN